MTGVELRPMSVGELLDRTFSLYRHNFVLFFGIMLLPSMLSSLGGLAVVMLQPRITPDGANPWVPADAVLFILAVLVSFVVSFIVYAAAVAATTMAVSEVHLGRGITIARCYGLMSRRLPGVLGISLFFLAIMVVGLVISAIMGTIAGIALAMVHSALTVFGAFIVFAGLMATAAWLIRFGVAVPALIIEQVPVGGALRRSVHLTKGFRLRVVLIFFLMMLISYVAAFIFQGPFYVAGFLLMDEGVIPIWIQALQIISGSIGGALSGPLLLIGMALLYFDVRIRKEALDLEIMMKGWSTPGTPAGSV